MWFLVSCASPLMPPCGLKLQIGSGQDSGHSNPRHPHKQRVQLCFRDILLFKGVYCVEARVSNITSLKLTACLPSYQLIHLSAVSCQLSAVSYQLSAASYQLPAISCQQSAASHQLSAISCQLSAASYELPAIS